METRLSTSEGVFTVVTSEIDRRIRQQQERRRVARINLNITVMLVTRLLQEH